MNRESRGIQRVYLTLLLLHTLAASLIWGINTLFLLDAGLSNAQAFAANAFFTAGLMLFEVPTGVIADTRGRRISYLMGTITLTLSTLAYLWMWRVTAPFWAWAIVSIFLGLGFTFFSGATEAWLVDALKATNFDGKLESVFAKGKIAEGVAMLIGAIGGGWIAQTTGLGTPYVIRAILLALSFAVAFVLMRDVGFTPTRGKHVAEEMSKIVRASMKHGLGNQQVRWIMLASPFTDGVMIYAFYAMQPYLLQLYGNPRAYGISGVAAAIMAGAQIAGGLLVPRLSKLFARRTSALLLCVILSTSILFLIGLLPHFWSAIGLFLLWSLIFSTVGPIRQAYLNDHIPSEQRATVLSFSSLLGSAGGVAFQPLLGRAADVWSYPVSYLCSAAIQSIAVPIMWMARRQDKP
jgi:MFS family permease